LAVDADGSALGFWQGPPRHPVKAATLGKAAVVEDREIGARVEANFTALCGLNDRMLGELRLIACKHCAHALRQISFLKRYYLGPPVPQAHDRIIWDRPRESFERAGDVYEARAGAEP